MNIPVTTPVPGNGNSISIGPPLKLGRYFVGVFNPDTVAHTVYILATLAFSPEAITTLDVNSAGPVPLLDDAVTTDQICVSPTGNIPDFTIQDFRVGLQVDHARISDLVFHLISPDGTRYLLMESRGTTSTNGAGLSTLTTNVTTLLTNYTVLVTNVTVISNNFESVLATDYLAGATVKNWVVTTSQVSVVADPTNAYTGTNFLALASGGISYTLPPTLTGGVYTLTFACRGPGIVSLWRGESNAVDSINGHNGTFLSDPRYVTNGEVGQDFYFTGAGSPSARINVTDSPDFILTNAVTIEAWVWASNVVVGSQGGYVLFRGDDNPGLDSYFLEIDHSSQVFYFRIQQSNNAGGWSDLTYNFTPYLSQWVHVAGAWDARSRLQQLYINGLVITQAVTSIIPVGTLSPAANPGIGIGNNQSLGYNTPWRGHLDEVSLYRRALSASEIKAIYQRGSAGKFDPGYGFSTNLAEAQITVSGATNIIFGNNTSWQVYSVTGQTPTNGAALTITGLEPGMLLDTFVVTNVTISASNVTATLFVTNVSASTFYLTFTENTNLTTTPIKFAAPPFVPVLPASTNGFFDGFETVAAGDYTNGQAFSPGWTVISNQVSVITDPTNAYEGNNFLALAGGVISNTLPTLAGQTYTLSFAYRGPGIAGLWRGESNEVDSIYGNNGTIVNAGYTNGVVGRAFELDPENWPVGTYNAVDVPDDPRYILTNSLSIEGWIRPRGDGFSIFWRGDNRSGFDPYFLSMQGNNTCSFYIEDAAGTTANVGVPLIYDQWWHVAGTLDGNTGIMTIYTNGVIAGQLTTALRPFGNLNPGLSPGVGIGNVNDGINNFPFWGDIDEISLYGRALSASEINAIYQKGSAGKYSAASFAGNLAEATVNLPGAAPVTLTGNNTTWQLYTTTFTATQNGTPLQITGLEPGMLLDAFGLTNSTVATNLYYLPEQDMSAIKGQSALGCWTLEVQDDRAGATNDATLVSWQLGFTFANTNLPPPVPILPPGVPITNVVAGVAAGDPISWFQVNVPANATAATNRLIWATAPVSLLYSTNNPQTTGGPGDAVLIANSMGPAANVLTPATVPALVPGGSYYLGVQNNNGFDVTNVIEVDFDIPTTVLTGGQPVTNTLPGGGLDYYSVTVPTNADFATNLLLFGTGPLNLLFNQSAPPTGSNPGDFTLLAGVTSGSSVLSAGSTPPLVPGQTYYLGVRNPGASSVTYALQVDFHLVPPPVTTTNVVWTLINVPTNADWATNLLVSSSAPVSVWWSTNNPPSITNANDFEMIPAATNGLYVLGTNTVPAFIVPGGSYWLGVENTNGVAVTNDVQVHFHLVLPPGPILISSITPTNVSGTFGFQLTWYAPTNDVFMVQWTPKIAPPVVWNTFTNIITYKLLTPTNGIGFFEFLDDGTQSGGLAPGRFYRLRLLGTNAPPVPTNNVVWTLINVPTNADWATNLLVSSSAPVSVWWSTNNPPSVTNAKDFEMIPAATNGLYVLGTNTVPAFIVPGGSYWLGVENTNGFGVTNVVQVKFHLVPPPGPVPISSITPTNASGTLGFRLTWYGPTNNVFMVQWTPGIAPPVAWHTFTNIITYTSLTPTNGIGFFEFIDDGSQSGGLAPGRYYRLRQLGLGTNTPPVFVATPPNQTILAYSALAVTNNAVDAEAPPQTLTYSLPGAPAGATISGRGVITWTPTLAQANTTNRITTVVTDNGLPPLSVTNRFTVIVPPSLLRPPAAFTLPATFVTGTSARLSGFASPNGSPVAAWFEWGSNQLVANQTAPLAVSGGTQVVWLTNALAGLADGQAYYFRLVVSNQVAVARGAIQEFGDGSVLGWGDNSSGQTNAPANLTNAVAIAGGEFHTVALAGDGTVTAWGDNTYNQTNIPAGLSGVVAVAAEAYDNLALTGDGAVVAWGDDTYNQTNVPAGLNSVVAVACGAFHNLALKTDGTVVAWGDDTYNQTNIPPGLSNVVAVAAGWYHSLALRNDGTVAAWGYNYYGQAAVPAGLSNVVAVAAGVSHSLALKNDGTAVMWGDGSSGQTNVSPALSGVLAIACGDYHSLALKSDGTMTAWGYSVDGETNVPPGLDKVVAVAGGGYHSLALRAAVATPLVIPAISSVLWTNNSLVLEWTAPIYETFHVQWAASIAPPVSWNTFPAIVTSTNGVFTFADTSAVIGVRFYRLALP